MIDVFNRTLADQIGIEYMHHTRCFETRFSHHLMLPISEVNAANACSLFLPQRYGQMTRKQILHELAYKMVHNAAFVATRGGPSAGPGPVPPRFSQTRIDGGPPSRESPGKHVLIPLHQVPGYEGPKQQRCMECNELVSWCCARCSLSPSCIVPLHPVVAQGSGRHYGCLAAHRANPAGGYRCTHEKIAGTSTSSKRRRRIPVVSLFDIPGAKQRKKRNNN